MPSQKKLSTYDSELAEIESSKALANLSYEKEKDALWWKQLFSKADMSYWEERYDEEKMKRPYLILFGVAIGALITIVIIHYT